MPVARGISSCMRIPKELCGGRHIVLAERVGGCEGATLLPNEEESCSHVRIVKWGLVRQTVRTYSSLPRFICRTRSAALAIGAENVRGAGDVH